ncbi:MAG: phage tail length tape measure family protein [Candidatus Omnitrophica bacterium]|nr:phage tail length tape measure family protein [Candidatus Omnitrophota bacterium]
MAGERELEIKLLLSDKEALSRLKGALDSIEGESKKAAGGFIAGWKQTAAAIGGVIVAAEGLRRFMGAAIDAAIQQEDAINRLNVALKNQGTFTDELSLRYQDMANRLQASTRFSDEAINTIQQRLVAIGNVGPESMERVTKATLDFATATGTDLVTAAEMMAKAADGDTKTLERWIGKIDASIPKSERFVIALDLMNQKFGGAAQADVNTFGGAVAQLSNTWGEFLEQIGNIVVKSPEAIKAIQELNSFLQTMMEILEKISPLVSTVFDSLLKLRTGGFFNIGAEAGESILEKMFGGAEAEAAVLEQAAQTGEAVKQHQLTLEEELAAIRQEFNETDFQSHLLNEERKIETQRQMLLAWHDEKSAAVLVQQQRETEFNQLYLDTLKKAHETFWPTVGKLRDQFASGLAKMFTDAITGSENFGDAFKALGKQMIATLVEYAVQLAVNAALAKALQAAHLATTIPIATATAAAWAPAAALVSLATFGTNAAGAMAALTSVTALAKALALIPGLEEGGSLLSPGRVLVGESGPEFLDLPRGARVAPLEGISQPVINISVVLNHPIISSSEIADEFARMIAERVSEFLEVERARL